MAIAGELDRRFRWTQWYVGALVAGCWLALALISWLTLRDLNIWMASLEGPANFQLFPSSAIWLFFPFFGGLTFGWLLTEALLPSFLGKETAEVYLYWTNAKAGFQSGKVFRFGAIFVAVPIGALTAFAIPVHATFHEARMTVRSYGSFRPTTHQYEQIRALTTTDGIKNRAGQFVRDPCILVDFADGTRWSSGDNLRDPDRSINADLKEFLSQKSGVAFRHVTLEYDLSGK